MKNKILSVYIIFISLEICFFLYLIILASENTCSFYHFYDFNVFESKIHLTEVFFNFLFLILNLLGIKILFSKLSKKVSFFYILVTFIGAFIFALSQYAYVKTFLGSYACFIN